MKILLGVSGGIAAYKAAELTRLLQDRGHRVQVILTRAAGAFVQPLTFSALTGLPVLTDLFTEFSAAPAPHAPPWGSRGPHDGACVSGARGTAALGPAPPLDNAIEHIRVAQEAEVLVVAPATANCLARFAHGLAEDYLSTVFLATPAPVVLAPAMNVVMWQHPATQANVAALQQRGVAMVPPGEGYLACGMTGAGRMADLAAIADAVETAGARSRAWPRSSANDPTNGRGEGRSPSWPCASIDLAGETVLVSAGPTREALDPVRYLSNRSSGRMGYALAAAAAARGARVYLVSGPTALPAPPGVDVLPITTAAEMLAACESLFERCTIAILAAAVADYRPAHVSPEKIKKDAPQSTLALERTPDILATLGARKQRQVLVGFAAETDPRQGRAHARDKLAAKHADMIVYNDVSRPDIGFDVDRNQVVLITPAGEQEVDAAPKLAIAGHILNAVLPLLLHAHRPA